MFPKDAQWLFFWSTATKSITNLFLDPRSCSKREETGILNTQLISWGAHTAPCSCKL